MIEIENNLNQLEENIKKSIHDARHWVDVCCELDKIFNAYGTVITSISPTQRGAWMTYSPSMHDLINEYISDGWHLRDHRQALTQLALEKKVVTDHDYITISEKSKVPYYTDLLYPHGIGALIAITVETPNGIWVLTIQCSKDRPSLNKEEYSIAHRISNLMSVASFKAEEQSKRKFKEFISLLGESVNDVIILDPNGVILDIYEGMKAYRSNSIIKIGGFFHDLVDPKYMNEILSVCKCPASENTKLTFQHVINGEKFATNIMQVPASIRHYYSSAKAICYTSKLTHKPDEIDKILNEKYALTYSEIAAAKFLAEGYSIIDISEVLGLEESTVRQRFKAIYSKTGVTSQAKLVSMMFKITNGTWAL